MAPRLSSALALIAALASPALAQGARFGIGAGVVVPLEVRVDGRRPTVAPGPVLLVSVDRALHPALDVGAWLNVASITAEARDEQVNLFGVGLAAHYARPTPTLGGVLRLGGGVGYRQLFADASGYDRVRGLALNADVELSGRLAPGLLGFVEVGALSQPLGENREASVTFLPMPYLVVGALF